MEAADLNAILHRHEALRHVKVLGLNEFLRQTEKGLFIVNSKSRPHPGEHWFAVATDTYPTEVFDSTGRHPSYYSHELSHKLGDFVYNSSPLQRFDSSLCGSYCIYYCAKHVRGCSFANILFMFKYPVYNDYYINQRMREAMDAL